MPEAERPQPEQSATPAAPPARPGAAEGEAPLPSSARLAVLALRSRPQGPGALSRFRAPAHPRHPRS